MALKQKTVYFREEDLPKWDAIKNKAEWLHQRLHGIVDDLHEDLKKTTSYPEKLDADIEGMHDMVDDTFNFCKAGHMLDARGKCSTKGCKYA